MILVVSIRIVLLVVVILYYISSSCTKSIKRRNIHFEAAKTQISPACNTDLMSLHEVPSADAGHE